MRLWHKDLIPVLPEMQLRGQWREMLKREYKADSKRLIPYIKNAEQFNAFWKMPIEYDNLFDCYCNGKFIRWHHKRYLRQCLYNLEEKAIAGGIPYQEWLKIVDKFGNEFDLWE